MRLLFNQGLKLATKSMVCRVEVLLEVPNVQDDDKEFAKLQQAKNDLMYGVELEPDILDLVQTKLDEFNL